MFRPPTSSFKEVSLYRNESNVQTFQKFPTYRGSPFIDCITVSESAYSPISNRRPKKPGEGEPGHRAGPYFLPDTYVYV